MSSLRCRDEGKTGNYIETNLNWVRERIEELTPTLEYSPVLLGKSLF
jgi:hypothetical protein